MVGVGILMKCTKVIVSQPIITKQGQTCKGSKKSHQDVNICIQKRNQKITNIAIMLGEKLVEIMVTVVLGGCVVIKDSTQDRIVWYCLLQRIV